MKKKDLLLDWEIIQQEYYEQFNRSEIEEKYNDWFFHIYINEQSVCKSMEKSQMINELIKDELKYRKEDTIEELKETIEHIEKLNFIK